MGVDGKKQLAGALYKIHKNPKVINSMHEHKQMRSLNRELVRQDSGIAPSIGYAESSFDNSRNVGGTDTFQTGLMTSRLSTDQNTTKRENT